MFAVNGILFNHEGPRRGETFVTRKITRAVANIKFGQMDYFEIGNLDARRDWGHAKDFVECMWMMLQVDKPTDYLIATGKLHSVRQFVVAAFKHIGVAVTWEGEGVEEVGKDAKTGEVRVKVHPRYFRPSEVNVMDGDPSKVRARMHFCPFSCFFFQAEDGIRDFCLSRGLGDVYKRQTSRSATWTRGGTGAMPRTSWNACG